MEITLDCSPYSLMQHVSVQSSSTGLVFLCTLIRRSPVSDCWAVIIGHDYLVFTWVLGILSPVLSLVQQTLQSLSHLSSPSFYIFLSTCTHTNTHTHSHTCTHTYTHIVTHTYTHSYTCTHTHSQTCAHTYIVTHAHTHTHSHTHIHTHEHTYTNNYTCTHTHSHLCIHTYMSSHMHTLTHMYSHMRTHTYTEFQRKLNSIGVKSWGGDPVKCLPPKCKELSLDPQTHIKQGV